MANKIIIKKSSVASKVPVAGDLEVAELAVNLADAKLYTKNASGTVIQLGGGSGGGDVSGPASATDNAITRFDSTTGKLIQNSTVTLDDNGNIINANSIGLDTTPATVPTTVGTMSWDDGDGVPTVALKGGNVNLQVGTQEYARVYNDSGSTLTIGQAVYISGAQGNRVAVKLARANVEATSFGTIGLVAETITNGSEGFIITSGALYKLNTTGLTAGATVYVSPTTAGAVTTTKPQAPDQLVVVGWVERVNATVGSIYVKVDNGYELDELHDVQITTPTSGNTLIYDAVAAVWKNANLTAGTGVSVTNGAGSISIANTGVTSLTAGTGITLSASTGGITISASAASSQSLNYDNFTATASQTIFNTSASYTSGKIQAFKNGALMRNGSDVTVTSGTQVVFAVACTVNDLVTLVYPPAASSGTMRYDQFTSTASQTTFTTSATYTNSKIQVFVNGALQRNGVDVTVTSGTNIVFATGLASGDLVDVTYPV